MRGSPPRCARACSSQPCRGRLDRRARACRAPPERTAGVKWNLRLAAAQRGIWKASDLQRMLAEHGLVISAGKMSGLWSGQPASIKLDDLDIICVTLGCTVADVLIPEPEEVAKPVAGQGKQAAAAGAGPAVIPQRRDGRSLPPA